MEEQEQFDPFADYPKYPGTKNTILDFDIFITAAKAIHDNMPFTNTNFTHDSVNSIAEYLEEALKNSNLSSRWVCNVATAQDKGQPTYIDLNAEGLWSFYTMNSGTREELIEELRKVGEQQAKGNVKYVDKQSAHREPEGEMPKNRAERRFFQKNLKKFIIRK